MTSMFPHSLRSMQLRKRLSSTSALAGALLLALGGCTVGPDYLEPISNPMDFHSADAVTSRAATTPAPQLDRWWEGFNDPELTRIVQRQKQGSGQGGG
jgi:ABC-type phosphate transport system substrate-binding protein